MREQTWAELQEEAPLAVNACVHYFKDRYANWRAKMLEIDAILLYLQTKDIELIIATFGIPNRQDWYYELFVEGNLLRHEREFHTYELAAMTAILLAFSILESQLQ